MSRERERERDTRLRDEGLHQGNQPRHDSIPESSQATPRNNYRNASLPSEKYKSFIPQSSHLKNLLTMISPSS